MDKDLEGQLEQILKDDEVEKKLGQDSGRGVWDIPVGPAVVGGFTAILASELVDGILAPNYGKWWFRLLLRIIRRLPKRISDPLLERLSHSTVRALAKLALAGYFKDNPGILGSETGSKAMALLLAYEAIKDLTPLDEWAKKAAEEL